ncbi:hypothetical protein HDU97_006240 [Phlyctochytrium planicorne]|nr:hypothetical protein HDU97_006240 [Phlyctochytrium planicorne]
MTSTPPNEAQPFPVRSIARPLSQLPVPTVTFQGSRRSSMHSVRSTQSEIPFSHHSARSNCLACQLKRDRERALQEANPYHQRRVGVEPQRRGGNPPWRNVYSTSKSDSELPNRRLLHASHDPSSSTSSSASAYSSIPSRIDTGLVRSSTGKLVLRTTSSSNLRSPQTSSLPTPPSSNPTSPTIAKRPIHSQGRIGTARPLQSIKKPEPGTLQRAAARAKAASITASSETVPSKKRDSVIGSRIARPKPKVVIATTDEDESTPGRKVLRGGDSNLMAAKKEQPEVAAAAEPREDVNEDNDADDEDDGEDERVELEAVEKVDEFVSDKEEGREEPSEEKAIEEVMEEELVEEEVVTLEDLGKDMDEAINAPEGSKDASEEVSAKEAEVSEPVEPVELVEVTEKAEEVETQAEEVAVETPHIVVDDSLASADAAEANISPRTLSNIVEEGPITSKTFTILDASGKPQAITIPTVVQLDDPSFFSDTTSMVSYETETESNAPAPASNNTSNRSSGFFSRMFPKMQRSPSEASITSTTSTLTPVPIIRKKKRRQIDMSDLTGLATLATSRLNDLRAIQPSLRSSVASPSANPAGPSLKKSYLSAAKEISLLGKGIATAYMPLARLLPDPRLKSTLMASLSEIESLSGQMKVLVKLRSGPNISDRDLDAEGVILSNATSVVRAAQDAVKDLEAARVLIEMSGADAGDAGIGGGKVVTVSDDEDSGTGGVPNVSEREPGEGGMEAAVRAAIAAGGNVMAGAGFK